MSSLQPGDGAAFSSSKVESIAAAIESGDRLERGTVEPLLAHPNLAELGLLADRDRARRFEAVATYAVGGVLPVAASAPDLSRVVERLADRGVTCLLLAPDPGDPPSGVQLRQIVETAITRLPHAALIHRTAEGAGVGWLKLREWGLRAVYFEHADFELESLSGARDAGLHIMIELPASLSTTDWLDFLFELQSHGAGIAAVVTGPTGCRHGVDPLHPLGTAPSSFRYLQRLAWTRLVLDNVDHIGAAWELQGTKIGQVALRFGADDFGLTGLSTASGHRATPILPAPEIERLIRDAGFTPWRRDGCYARLPAAQMAVPSLDWEDRLPVVPD